MNISSLLAKLAALPMSRAVIVGLVLAGLYYMIAFDNGSNLQKAIDSKKTEIETARVLFNKAKAASENSKKFEEEMATFEKQLNDVSRYLPSDLSAGELRQALMTQAKAAGAEIVSIRQVGEVGKTAFYETIKMDIALRGNYAQLAFFLSNLSKLPRVLTFDQISLVAPNNADKNQNMINFLGTLLAYKYIAGTEPTARPE